MDNRFEMLVEAEKVSDAVNEGSTKGWKLVTSEQAEEGKMRLVFEPANTMIPRVSAGNMPDRPVDPNVAWLELIGLLGFLGIGYLVAGRTNDGIIRLVGYLALMVVGWTVVSLLTLVVIGLCLIPVMLVIQFGIPIWSALELKKELDAQSMGRV